MRAVLLDGAGHVSMGQVPAPAVGAGEALIRVTIAGICGTDLQLAAGYMGFRGTPGHEFVGVVEEVRSPADRALLGARVVGEINIGCDECPLCVKGLGRHCGSRRVLGILGKDGALAEYLTLPVSNLRAVPDAMTDEQAVFVEPTAAAFEILDQMPLAPAERVLVLGDGRLGLLVAQVLAAAGAAVTIAGRHPAKLALASSLGIDAVRSPDGLPAAAFPVVVDATGAADGLDAALKAVAPRGTVVMKTTCSTPTRFDASLAVVNEVTLIGSRCGRFEPAIAALGSGKVRVDRMVTERLHLEDAVRGFEIAARSESVKVLLRIAP